MTCMRTTLVSLIDLETSEWTLHVSSGFAPGARVDHKMIAGKDRVLLFGGMNLKDVYNDMLSLEKV